MAMVGGLSGCGAEGKSPILSIPVEVSRCIHHMHVCFDYFLIFICMHTDFKPQYVDNFHKYRCLASKAHECVLLVLIFWFCHLHYVHPEHQFE